MRKWIPGPERCNEDCPKCVGCCDRPQGHLGEHAHSVLDSHDGFVKRFYWKARERKRKGE